MKRTEPTGQAKPQTKKLQPRPFHESIDGIDLHEEGRLF